jgi:hypothetical protein
MNWSEVFGTVFFFYLRVLAIGFVYIMAKFLVLGYRRKESSAPDIVAKIICYATCVIVVAVVGFFAWGGYGTHTEGEGEDRYEAVDFVPTPKQRNTHGAKVFLAVLMPALLGVYRGFELKPEEFPPEVTRSSDDEW